jgi:hypothetical protein
MYCILPCKTTAKSVPKRVWNITKPYPCKSGAYLTVTAQNIPQVHRLNCFVFNGLNRFGPRAENPRVGGSIPPLATTNFLNSSRLAIEVCRGDPVLVPYLWRDFPCCRHRPPDAPRRGAHNAAPSSPCPNPRAPAVRRAVSRPARANSPRCDAYVELGIDGTVTPVFSPKPAFHCKLWLPPSVTPMRG